MQKLPDDNKQANNTPPDRVKEDKVTDITILVQLIKLVDQLHSLTEHTEDLAEKLSEILLKIAHQSKSLAWYNQSAEHIRNRYGKKNYATSNNNNAFIDWELLASIEHLFNDPLSGRAVVELLAANLNDFEQDFVRLKSSLKWIIKKEASAIDPSNTALYEDVSKLELRALKIKKINRLQYLPVVLHYFYDRLLLNEIQTHCRANQVAQLCAVPHDEHDRMRHYQTARLITSIGEAAKNLSDTCKRNYAIISLDLFSKVRNKIAHKHRKYILNRSPDVYGALFGLVSALPDLDYFIGLLQTNYTQFVPKPEDSEYQTKLWQAINNFMGFDYAHRIPYYCKRYFSSQSTTVQAVVNSSWLDLDLARYDAAMLLPVRATRVFSLRAELKKLDKQLAKANLTYKDGVIEEKTDLKSKLQRTQDKLNLLLARTDELTQEEQKIVTQAKKSIPKIQKDILTTTNARAAIDLTQMLECYRQNEAQTQCTLLMDVGRSYGDLQVALARQKRQSSSTNHGVVISKQDKVITDLRYKIRQLDDEIQFLSVLLRQHDGVSDESRLYAVEHALSVVGQCFRDLDDLNSQLYGDLINETVQDSIASTVQGRNKLIMHSLFDNHADKLMTLSVRQTLPITDDINAMNVILNTDPAKYTEELSLKMTEALNNIGCAFLRLGNYQQAEEYLNMAVGAFLRSHQRSEYALPESQVLRVTDFSSAQELNEFVRCANEGSKRYVIYIPDAEEVFIQVQLYHNVSTALHLQDRYDDAFVWLQRCFDLSVGSELLMREDYPWEIFVNYVGLLFHRDDPRANSVLNTIKHHLGDNAQQLNLLWINLAVAALKKDKFDEGLRYLENIDIDQADNVEVKLEYYRTRGGLRSARNVSKGDSDSTDVGLFERKLAQEREAFSDFRSALNILKSQRHELIHLRGDRIRTIEKNLRRNVNQQIASLAASLGNYCLVLCNVGRLPDAIAAGKEAIGLQEKHDIDPSTTYNNLAKVFRTNAIALRDQAQDEPYNIFMSEQDALKLYMKNIDNTKFVLRFTAMVSIGFIHEAQFEYEEAIEWVLRGYDLARNAKPSEVTDQERRDINASLGVCIANLKYIKVIELADNLMDKKQFWQALKLLEVLRQSPDTKKDKSTKLQVYKRISVCYMNCGIVDKALPFAKFSLQLAEQLYGAQHDLTQEVSGLLNKLQQSKQKTTVLKLK